MKVAPLSAPSKSKLRYNGEESRMLTESSLYIDDIRKYGGFSWQKAILERENHTRRSRQLIVVRDALAYFISNELAPEVDDVTQACETAHSQRIAQVQNIHQSRLRDPVVPFAVKGGKAPLNDCKPCQSIANCFDCGCRWREMSKQGLDHSRLEENPLRKMAWLRK
jgi:hypothetical protein